MKRTILLLSVFAVSVVAVSCSTTPEDVPTEPTQQESSTPPPPPLNEDDLVTKNVTYTGILEEGGVTIYQEGSHRLMLTDGKMVLLKASEESSIALSLYAEKLVRVQGDVMPTVEAGGTIMEVKDIAWIRRETDSQGNEKEVMRVLCGGENGAGCPTGFSCVLSEDGPGMCEEGVVESSDSSSSSDSSTSSSSTSSSEGSNSSTSSSSSSSSSSSATSSSPSSSTSSSASSTSSAVSGSYSQSVELMLKEDFSAGRWTQEYCSAHVGFCVPVHKNWYYKSFGAMSTVLWHVEIGAVDVQSTGDGPIVVELKSGDVVGLGVGDSDVRVVGERAIGYRSFSDNRHIEISGPKDLREPVEYITKGLTRTEAAGE